MCSTIHTHPQTLSHRQCAVAYILAVACLRALTHQASLKQLLQIKQTFCCLTSCVKSCSLTQCKNIAGDHQHAHKFCTCMRGNILVISLYLLYRKHQGKRRKAIFLASLLKRSQYMIKLRIDNIRMSLKKVACKLCFAVADGVSLWCLACGKRKDGGKK